MGPDVNNIRRCPDRLFGTAGNGTLSAEYHAKGKDGLMMMTSPIINVPNLISKGFGLAMRTGWSRPFHDTPQLTCVRTGPLHTCSMLIQVDPNLQ